MTEKEYIRRMQNQKYKDLEVTSCGKESNGKDYVFISYSSANWEFVLTEVVYKLQKEYGLHIYFDKAFSSKTNVWVEQFQENMDSFHCKAVLCFWTKEYVQSYATLLELMHAKNEGKKILPINFDFDYNEIINSPVADKLTGLGKTDDIDPVARLEREYFDEAIEILKNNKEYYNAILRYYTIKTQRNGLTIKNCANIFKALEEPNKRKWVDTKEFYEQFIIEPLKAIEKKENANLFDEVEPPEPTIPPEPPEPVEPPSPPTSEIYHLIESKDKSYRSVIMERNGEYTLMKDSKIKFDCNNSTPSKAIQHRKKSVVNGNIRLISEDITEKAPTSLAGAVCGGSVSGKAIIDTSKIITKGEADEILRKNKEEFEREDPTPPSHETYYLIQDNKKNIKSVIRKSDEKYTLMKYSKINRQYTLFIPPYSKECVKENSVIKNKERFIKTDITDTSFLTLAEIVYGNSVSEIKEEKIITKEQADEILRKNKEDLEREDPTPPPTSKYNYTLYGKRYSDNKMSEMMINIFEVALSHESGRIDEALEKLSTCIGEGDIIGVGRSGKVSAFRQGKVITINNRDISVGTSCNVKVAGNYLVKLLEICGLDKHDVFDYDTLIQLGLLGLSK